MSKFVFSGAECYCNFGIKGRLIGGGKAVDKNMSKVVVEDDMPLIEGICPVLKIACPQQFSPRWLMTDANVSINGKSPILKESFVSCVPVPAAFVMPVNSSDYIGNGDKIFVPTITLEKDNSSHNRSIKKTNRTDITNKECSTDNKPLEGSNNRTKILDDEYVKYETQDQKSKQREKNIITKFCSGNCPDEFKNNCTYKTAPSENLLFDNDSKKLQESISNSSSCSCYKENIEILRNTYYDDASDKYYCSAAHHHLIPGNQCLCSKTNDKRAVFPLLIKLANFSGYNINDHHNGIVLPTLLGIDKNIRVFVYYAISSFVNSNEYLHDDKEYFGSQLHIGSHSYDLRYIRKLRAEANAILTYKTIVCTKLADLQALYEKETDHICYMKEAEKVKKRFIAQMNKISDDMRQSILKYPYCSKKVKVFPKKRTYVSLTSAAYDMKISANSLAYILKHTTEE